MRIFLVFPGLAASVPLNAFSSSNAHLQATLSVETAPGTVKCVLPAEDRDVGGRQQEILGKRAGYVYGPSLIGNSSYFPSGELGNAMVKRDVDEWFADAAWVVEKVNQEATAAKAVIEKNGGLKRLEDYALLYQGLWPESQPAGAAPGVLSNATSDLLFAMERLSVNPYAVRRLDPRSDALAFRIDDAVAEAVANTTLDGLLEDGRLFLVDHSYLAEYPRSQGKHSAACQAYFYLHPESGQFLPLAIKTNVGADLVYTPADAPTDWLLAKTMFNANDLFFGQMYHLANSHAVAEIVYLTAIRTLSSRHPVLALLNRLMYRAFAIRPVGEQVLFNTGGFFDTSFALNNLAARTFATDFYPHTGRFRSNYFFSNLERRGLINCTYGPALPHFPFLEDGGRLVGAIRSFMSDFVAAYYPADDAAALSRDYELQHWLAEANGAGRVLDFPPAFGSTETLVDVLTHVAYLTGVSHHVLNSGEPFTTSGALPLHPAALYAPPPTAKGVTDIMPFMPPADAAIAQVALLARFNRPRAPVQNGTLLHMFNDEALLAKFHPRLRESNGVFMESMAAIARDMAGRSFDADGLSQGMPFVWSGLDPTRIPFYLSV